MIDLVRLIEDLGQHRRMERLLSGKDIMNVSGTNMELNYILRDNRTIQLADLLNRKQIESKKAVEDSNRLIQPLRYLRDAFDLIREDQVHHSNRDHHIFVVNTASFIDFAEIGERLSNALRSERDMRTVLTRHYVNKPYRRYEALLNLRIYQEMARQYNGNADWFIEDELRNEDQERRVRRRLVFDEQPANHNNEVGAIYRDVDLE